MKVLVIKTSSMGDVVHTLPALTDAAKHIPEIRFDWVIEEAFADIPELHFQVEQVIPIAWRRWRKQLVTSFKTGKLTEFFHELRANSYDYVIDAQGLLKSALLTRISRGLRCGYDFNSAREALSSLFYQRRYKISQNQHAVTRARTLFANSLNYPVPDDLPDYGLSLTNYKPGDLEVEQTPSLVFVHATARDNKLWPVSYWIQLARWSIEQGFTVQLPWGNETEKRRAEQIAQACGVGARVLPKMNLRELALLLLQAKAVVAVDTGLGHLAVALNVPTLSLYGPTDPTLIGTYGRSQVHLRCEPEGSRPMQMADLKPEVVWRKLNSLLPLVGEGI